MSTVHSSQGKLVALPFLTWLIFLNVTMAVFLECPRWLDCTLRFRHQCLPGSYDCGPCLQHYKEDKNGRCTLKKFQNYGGNRRHRGGKYIATSPDEAIDLIQSIFAKTMKMIQTAGTEHAAVDRYKFTTRPDTQPHIPSSSAPLDTVKYLEVKSPTDSTTAAIKISSTASTETEYHPLATNERRNGSPEALNETVSLTLVIICSITGMSGLVVAALCWYRLQREVRLAQKIAYTAYKRNQHLTPAMPTDTRMAASMEVHHFHSQKKKIMAMEEGVSKPEKQMSTDSEAENGDYTVYECPGLAPTGEMEIHNPLFDSSVLHGTSYTVPK